MDEKYFDCRRYIHPGDRVMIDSMWCCDSTEDGAHRHQIPSYGTVVAVYRKFIRVKLKKVTECVNRWDVLELRGRNVMNGCFAGHEVRV